MSILKTHIPLLIVALFVAVFALRQLEVQRNSRASVSTPDQVEEVLYLPNGQALQLISFGYRNALSQFLWFKTISYFGAHFQRDQNYRWFSHMCGLVSELNPLAEHVYQFCSTMLAWEAGAPKAATELLSKGIAANPQSWYLRYLRGFNYMLFLKDSTRAKEDFVAASKLPGAEPFVARIAAKKIAELDAPASAIEFLEQMLLHTQDLSARQALEVKLLELRRRRH